MNRDVCGHFALERHEEERGNGIKAVCVGSCEIQILIQAVWDSVPLPCARRVKKPTMYHRGGDSRAPARRKL